MPKDEYLVGPCLPWQNWALLDQYLKSHLRYEVYTKMAVSIAGLLVKQTEIGHEISEIFKQKQDLPFLVKSSL